LINEGDFSNKSKTKKISSRMNTFRPRITPSLMGAANRREQTLLTALSKIATMETTLKKVKQECATLNGIELISHS